MSSLKYPASLPEPFVETLHGREIPDNFRYLEDSSNPKTKKWIDEQTDFTAKYLQECGQEKTEFFKKRLTEMFNYERYSAPYKCGDEFYFFKNDGLQNQSVLYRLSSLDKQETKDDIFLDINTWSEDGTTALSAYAFSKNKDKKCSSYFAFGVTKSGSDWQTIYVRDTKTNQNLEKDVLQWVKFSSISWTHDEAGFFYSRYPVPVEYQQQQDAAEEKSRGQETSSLEYHQIYYHKLGTSQDQDIPIMMDSQHPTHMFHASVSKDGKFVVFSVSRDCEPVNCVFIAPLNEDGSLPNNINNINQQTTTATHTSSDLAITCALPSCVVVKDTFEGGELSYISNNDARFYFQTNINAQKYRIVAVDVDVNNKDNNKQLIEVLAEDPEAVLQCVVVVAQSLFIVVYLRQVHHEIELYRLTNNNNNNNNNKLVQVGCINLPDLGSIVQITTNVSDRRDSTFYFKFASFLFAGSTFEVDCSVLFNQQQQQQQQEEATTVTKLQPRLLKESKINNFETSDFETRQFWFPSKPNNDNNNNNNSENKEPVMIPMFVMGRKSLFQQYEQQANNNNQNNNNNNNNILPIYLYGYGGFCISLTPSFSPSRLLMLESLNGLYAIANIRGGAEFGLEWAKQGQKALKQNCFDDFCSAAAFLRQKFGQNNNNDNNNNNNNNDNNNKKQVKIVGHGGSNGGLLVAACFLQRPELFDVIVCNVGVLDMLRFHKFTIGKAWCSDYGCADNEEDFKTLIKYSPYHNIDTFMERMKRLNLKTYPSFLATTSDHDDRVVPLHSYKFVAALQHALFPEQVSAPGQRPVLIRIERKAGHGAGLPLSKLIAEYADVYSFICHEMGLSIKPDVH